MAETRIDELRRRLDRDPGSRLFAQLAEEHRKAGNHADAIRVARSGLAQHPSYPSARLTLGRALLESGDPAGARAELEALGELAPALEQLQKTLKMAPGDRQLESQIVSLQTRLRSSQPAPAPAPRPPGPPPAAEPPAMPAAAWEVTARMPRAAAPAASAVVPEPEPPPPTIRIRPPGESGTWARRNAVPPPLPATAAPTAATPAGPPPLPAAVSPEVVAETLPAPAPSVYESDMAPTLPLAHGAGFGLVDETAVPTLPPGAVTAEEMVLEPEPAPEPAAGLAAGPLLAEAEPRLVPDLLPPLDEPRTKGGAAPAPPPSPAGPATAPGPGPIAQPGQAEAGGTAGAPFPSSTLAELYLRQGLVDRAVEVYRQLLAGEPGNARARARLVEIERMPSPDAARAARRQALERTIAKLEALLAVVRRR